MPSFRSYNTSDSNTGNLPLKKEEEVKLASLQTGKAELISGSVFSDKPGTLYIEQSFDGGEHWDVSTSHAIEASSGKGFEEPVLAPIAQVRYVNGAEDQGVLRIFTRCFVSGGK